MSSLLDTLKSQITPDMIQNIATSLGESGTGVQSALTTSGVAMLASLAGQANNTSMLGQVMNLIKGVGTSAMGAAAGAGNSYTTAAGTASSVASQAGSSLINMVFGGNTSSITDKIAGMTGLRSSSAGSILASAAPMVLGALASKVSAGGLNTSGLGNLLSAELPALKGMLPAGLAIPGLSGLTSSVSNNVMHARDTVRNEAARAKPAGWLAPLVIAGIILLGLIIWYFNRGSASTAVNTASNAASSAATTAANAISSAGQSLGAFFQTTLPDGVSLNIPQNGVENRLLTFIKDPNAQVSSDTWFDFDRLLFDTNSATLQPSSQEQLSNIAAILKAYPNVKLRIGGYTDNQGDAAANLKLSQDRANNVMQQLVAMGVDPSRLDAKGYGEDHPVADNTTDTGRAMNRRISMRVTAK
jgi:OOP family OmpA-OmpF porin